MACRCTEHSMDGWIKWKEDNKNKLKEEKEVLWNLYVAMNSYFYNSVISRTHFRSPGLYLHSWSKCNWNYAQLEPLCLDIGCSSYRESPVQNELNYEKECN